jgi:hypothetical protein
VGSAEITWQTPKDILETEAEEDNPVALYILAECYKDWMNGCVKNIDKSSELYQRGSKLADKGLLQILQILLIGYPIGNPAFMLLSHAIYGMSIILLSIPSLFTPP